jgi:hypothetical protein
MHTILVYILTPYLNCWQHWLFALRLTICLIQIFFKKLMENIFNQMFENRYILHFRVHLWSWEINHILSPFFYSIFLTFSCATFYMVALIKYNNNILLLWEHFNIQDAYHYSVGTPSVFKLFSSLTFYATFDHLSYSIFLKKLMDNIFNQMFANRYIWHFLVHLWSLEINYILSIFFYSTF